MSPPSKDARINLALESLQNDEELKLEAVVLEVQPPLILRVTGPKSSRRWFSGARAAKSLTTGQHGFRIDDLVYFLSLLVGRHPAP
jgi:hypothetical protein